MPRTGRVCAMDRITLSRARTMLETAFGPIIRIALDDPAVTDILVNADGRLWIERHGDGKRATDFLLTAAETERVIRLVASQANVAGALVSAELPVSGERFEGLLPPVVRAPAFAIRKAGVRLQSLMDYVTAGVMTAEAARALSAAVTERRNILIAGGTGSGKTTLANALLAEIAETGDRIVILEDTRELHCTSPDSLALRTGPGVTLSDLVRSTLRLRPDRIVVGEVRGGEALDLLKAWNTGHPGGIATVHAGSAAGALSRLEQLVQEAVVTVPRALIADSIHIIAVLDGRGTARCLRELARVEDGRPVSCLTPQPQGEMS